MSYCGALPTASGESEADDIIDACLSHIRKDARLDDEPVLPPLHTLIPTRPPPLPTFASTAPPAPVVNSVWSVRASVSPEHALVGGSGSVTALSRSAVRTVRKPRSLVQRLRWPVFLCGFVAGIFAGMALMKSPIGDKPLVRQAVKAARRNLVLAYTATSVAKSHLVKR